MDSEYCGLSVVEYQKMQKIQNGRIPLDLTSYPQIINFLKSKGW